jgi:hypothetical protein
VYSKSRAQPPADAAFFVRSHPPQSKNRGAVASAGLEFQLKVGTINNTRNKPQSGDRATSEGCCSSVGFGRLSSLRDWWIWFASQ